MNSDKFFAGLIGAAAVRMIMLLPVPLFTLEPTDRVPVASVAAMVCPLPLPPMPSMPAMRMPVRAEDAEPQDIDGQPDGRDDNQWNGATERTSKTINRTDESN